MGTMGPPGTDLARGYIEHRLEGDQIPEESAQQIIQVADQVLMAGLRSCQALRLFAQFRSRSQARLSVTIHCVVRNLLRDSNLRG